MQQRTRRWLLVGILIIAIFFRFYHFTTTPPGLYPDEAIDGNNAAEVVATGHPQVFYTEDNGREGLYVNLVAIVLKLYPVYEPWIIRLPAAIAGVLTVLGLYALGAQLFNEATGLLAAFFLATSFWHINFSRIGFRAILAPLLLTWAVYFLLRIYRSERLSKKTVIYAVLGGIFYGLGFYTYIAYRITPLLLMLFVPFFRKTKYFLKKSFLFIIACFITAAPIGLYFLQHPADFFGRTSEISVANTAHPLQNLLANILKTALMFNIHGDDNWRHNLSGAPELWWPIGILFVVGIAIGIVELFSRRRQLKSENTFSILMIFLWLILAGLPAVISDEGIPHALRSILMLPPAIMLAALGGISACHFLKKLLSHAVVLSIGILFLGAAILFVYLDYFVAWAENPNVPGAFNAEYVTIGHEINMLPSSTPKYVVVFARGVSIRGLPTPVETTMFITNTFTTSTQFSKHVHYLLPSEENAIPTGTPSATVFSIR